MDIPFHSLNSKEQHQVALTVIQQHLEIGIPISILHKRLPSCRHIDSNVLREWVDNDLKFAEAELKKSGIIN